MINNIKQLKQYLLEHYGKYNLTYDNENSKTFITKNRRYKFPISEEDIKRIMKNDKNRED